MNTLININTDNDYNQTVSGRELHEFLEISTRYNDWFLRMCEYGFTEGTDYYSKMSKTSEKGGRPSVDHILTLNMAKELCMLARNEKGKQARQYFLEVEKDWNTPEKVMARALIMASHKIEKQQKQLDEAQATVQEQTKQLEEAKPKVIFADAVAASSTSLSVAAVAKIINQNGISMGQNRFFAWLRDNGYLVKGGADKNVPTQKAMDMKLFEIREGSYINSQGVNITTKTPLITGKGQQYFINKFLNRKAEKAGVVA